MNNLKLHLTTDKGCYSLELKDSSPYLGLKLNSKFKIENSSQLSELKEKVGFKGNYLKIKGGSGTDGTPLKLSLGGKKPMYIKTHHRYGLVKLFRYRPNIVNEQTRVLDCICIE